LDWFERGTELEESAPEEARAAYGRALELEPEYADAHVNLGRLLQLERRVLPALEHYQAALRTGSDDPTAAFNLGTALETLGRTSDAIQAYHRALDIDGEFADAHFNLARLYELTGRRAAALRHLREYQRLSRCPS
jgi:tetratricopeptide (TPR) repeat protein